MIIFLQWWTLIGRVSFKSTSKAVQWFNTIKGLKLPSKKNTALTIYKLLKTWYSFNLKVKLGENMLRSTFFALSLSSLGKENCYPGNLNDTLHINRLGNYFYSPIKLVFFTLSSLCHPPSGIWNSPANFKLLLQVIQNKTRCPGTLTPSGIECASTTGHCHHSPTVNVLPRSPPPTSHKRK